MPTPMDWERTSFNLVDNLSITHFFPHIGDLGSLGTA